MRFRHGAAVLLAVVAGCSFPVETFEVVDAPAKDGATGGDGAATDAAPSCSGATPDLCDGKCTNLSGGDVKNCGICGKACKVGEKCEPGSGGGGPGPRCK